MDDSDEPRKTKIGRSVYLVENGKKSIIKYEPPATNGLLQNLSRQLFGGSLPFRNEMHVNELLKRARFETFNYPTAVIHTNPRSIEFEFVEGVEEVLNEPLEREVAIKSLVEYSRLWEQYKIAGLAGFALKYIESPLRRTFLSVLSSDHALSIKLKALSMLATFVFRKKVTSPVLLHNDLQCKNILKIEGGGICYIDFEDATIEHRLILVDAVNILLDKNRLTLDKKLLILFWNAFLASKQKNKSNEALLKEQVRICLLRLAFSPCSADRADEQDRQKTKELLLLVMDDHGFDRWWSDQ